MSRTEVKVTTQEAQRQVEIIGELKKVIQAKKEELGRDLFYTAVTFGCPSVSAVEILESLTIKGSYKRTFGLAHS